MKENNIVPKSKKHHYRWQTSSKLMGITKILRITNFKKFSSIKDSIKKTIIWYKEYFFQNTAFINANKLPLIPLFHLITLAVFKLLKLVKV